MRNHHSHGVLKLLDVVREGRIKVVGRLMDQGTVIAESSLCSLVNAFTKEADVQPLLIVRKQPEKEKFRSTCRFFSS